MSLLRSYVYLMVVALTALPTHVTLARTVQKKPTYTYSFSVPGGNTGIWFPSKPGISSEQPQETGSRKSYETNEPIASFKFRGVQIFRRTFRQYGMFALENVPAGSYQLEIGREQNKLTLTARNTASGTRYEAKCLEC